MSYTSLAQSIADRSRANRARLSAISQDAKQAAEVFRDVARNGQVLLRSREQVKDFNGIPGFFPTPLPLVRYLIEKAELHPCAKILEPSAGAGHIAEQLRGNDLTLVEINFHLCEFLRAKGFDPIYTDFLTWQTDSRFDRIVMNPPFENLADTLHVQRAFELLAPRGILVSIMGAGAFFRQDRKARDFRDWLEFHHGESEKLPEGSFVSSEVSTNVNTYIIRVKNETY